MVYPIGTPHHLDNDIVKDSNNNTLYGFGLFPLTINEVTHFYYCKPDGSIVKNETFYVEKTRQCWVQFDSSKVYVEEGLYYFDINGYMWYGNNLLDFNSKMIIFVF